MTVTGNVTFDVSRASRCTLRATPRRRGAGTRSRIRRRRPSPAMVAIRWFIGRLPPNFRITTLAAGARGPVFDDPALHVGEGGRLATFERGRGLGEREPGA